MQGAQDERVLVTTLTKKMAEDLTEYLKNAGIRVRYMHSDVQTIERMEIIRDLRLGEFDVLVGINLLREGLDLPEVSLVAILDADKEGFLRSETCPDPDHRPGGPKRRRPGHHVRRRDHALHAGGHRRDGAPPEIQDAYNQAHGIVPKTIIKGVREILEISKTAEEDTLRAHKKRKLTEQERAAEIAKLEKDEARPARCWNSSTPRCCVTGSSSCGGEVTSAKSRGVWRTPNRRESGVQAFWRRQNLEPGRIHF